MEKKKLLLVAVSVGVFLVILISASILIFTPKAAGVKTAFSSSRPVSAGIGGTITPERSQPATVDASDMVKNTDGIWGIQTPPSANASQETNFYLDGEKTGVISAVEQNDGGASAKVTINVPNPSTAAVPHTPAAPARSPAATQPAAKPAVSADAAAKPAVSTSSAAPQPAAAKPAVAAAKPAVTPAASTSAVSKPAAAAPAATGAKTAQTQSKPRSDYWVQTGAFSTQARAEGAKETLASKGITSIIENRMVDGKTWYRVRVGPYTSENEAKYWLALVKSVDGFNDSQIRQTLR
jgi:DedD protein